MTFFFWIVLASMAIFVATAMTSKRRRHQLALCGTLVLFGAGMSGTASAANAPDSWITTKVKMALVMADGVSATAINVDTMNGKVTLAGTVASSDEKARAEKATRSVSGVHEVRSLLQVVAKPRQEVVAVDDDKISEAVDKKLAADPALRDSKITAKSVNKGVVLLQGKANSLSAHLRALAVARAVPGVTRVASEISSPDTLADNEIWHDADTDPKSSLASAAQDAWVTSAVKVRLMANSDTPARDINVDTSAGVVTLFGTVPTEATRSAAATEARKVDGVKGVENELQVVSQKAAAAVEDQDEKSKSAIEKTLKGRDELSGSSIDVEVAGGVARLTGSVDSQSDRLTALTLARNTDGVRSVIGDLTVKVQ
jgi:hyperosmotically inducible protein